MFFLYGTYLGASRTFQPQTQQWASLGHPRGIASMEAEASNRMRFLYCCKGTGLFSCRRTRPESWSILSKLRHWIGAVI